MSQAGRGPLHGTKVIELAGIGPAPYAASILAELGADVVRVDRHGGMELFPGDPRLDVLNRGKRSILIDLKKPGALEVLMRLVDDADVLLEGYRPGVTERLGIGPEDCWKRNPALVYGRMTGWGQHGPLAQSAGHDIDYIALTGVLHAIGAADGPPQIPLNVVGDYGGGSTFLVIGILAALLEERTSRRGQVVDAAIVDGVSHLLAGVHALMATGTWRDARGANMSDGGRPFYDVYETEDGRHMAVGAVEPKFWAELIRILDIDVDLSRQHDPDSWPETRTLLAKAFRARTQAEWAIIFDGTDACVAPVMSLREAAEHPHMKARGSIVVRDGVMQPGPAPRFSRTQAPTPTSPPRPGQHTRAVLQELRVDNVEALLDAGAVVQA
ncbi:CaiB/BaiF CoA transferase family protein [Mycobacterium sp. NPDC003449]